MPNNIREIGCAAGKLFAMTKSAVFMIELNQGSDLSYASYCYKTWEWWGRQHGIDVLVLQDAVIDPQAMPATWQRYWLFKLLEQNGLEYDQVAMIDIDTMVRWDCPNFFELTEGKYTSVLDRCGVGWVNQAIKGYQDIFSDVCLEWWEFFFAGFVIANRQHQTFYETVIDFYWDNFFELNQRPLTLKKGTDIAPVNFLVKRERVATTFLSPNYHLCSLQQKNVLANREFIDLAYSWHFNGFPKSKRLEVMKDTWQQIGTRYSGETPGKQGSIIKLSADGILSGEEKRQYLDIAKVETKKLFIPSRKLRSPVLVDRIRRRLGIV